MKEASSLFSLDESREEAEALMRTSAHEYRFDHDGAVEHLDPVLDVQVGDLRGNLAEVHDDLLLDEDDLAFAAEVNDHVVAVLAALG